MAIYCGFFNSVNGDRLYQAEDMNRPYEMLVSNGVFATPNGTPSDYLQVYATDGMIVKVRPGRARFFDKWFINDSDYFLNVDASEVTLKRIDSVVVKIDKSEAVRLPSIYIKKGTPASSPVPPELTRTALIREYRLANITVDAGVSSITQAKINDRRGYTEECGWVTSLIQQVDTTTLWEQWDDAFNTWLSDVKEHLSTSTLIRTFTNTYVTTKQDETVIPIGIPQFTYNLDILQVYINGLMLIRDLEYTSDNDSTITLTNGVDAGTPVSFVIYKSVDGSNAETIIEQVETLVQDVAALTLRTTANEENIDALMSDVEALENLRITATDGTPKLSITDTSKNILTEFINLGVGFHTVYAATGVQDLPPTNGGYRCFGHVHTENTAWIMAIHTNGSTYVNFRYEGAWVGWRTIYEHSPAPLWTGDSLLAEGTITPSKRIVDCQHGWQLVFSDWNEETSAGSSTDLSTVLIPKRNLTGANWGGSSFLCAVPTYLADDGTYTLTVKKVYVYPDRLEGWANNVVSGAQMDCALRAIYEY